MIVTRDRTISKNLASTVGFDTAFELFRLRERRLQGTLGPITVLEALKDELDLVGRCELEYEDKAPVGEELGREDEKS